MQQAPGDRRRRLDGESRTLLGRLDHNLAQGDSLVGCASVRERPHRSRPPGKNGNIAGTPRAGSEAATLHLELNWAFTREQTDRVMVGAASVGMIGDMVDRAVAKVAEQEFRRLSRALSEEEAVDHVHRALAELRKLREGSVPAYDCEWVALFYLTWYQARQINLVYSLLVQRNVGLPRRLHVVDLGCGAMAVQFALAIFAATSGQAGTRISLTGIDSSRQMIAIGVELWKCFRKMIREEVRGFRTPETIHLLDRVTTVISKEYRTFDSLDSYRRSYDECIRAEADRRAAAVRSTLPSYLVRHRAIRAARDRLAAHFTYWMTSIHAVYHFPQQLRLGRNILNPQGILLTADGPHLGDVASVHLFREVEVEPKRHGCLLHTTRWRRELNRRLRRQHSYLDRAVEWNPQRNKIEEDLVWAWGTFQ